MSATTLSTRLTSSVARELLVALSGLAMVGFVIAHLGGNLLIFAGPEAFNAYAKKLADLGALLWVARIGLIAAFVAHVLCTIWLTLENRSARGSRYQVVNYSGRKTWATRVMIFSGIIIFFFIFLHLNDFTFADKHGPNSIVEGLSNGESLGLYGVVYNAFSNPLHALVYIVAVWAVGFHLTHAVSSIWVTLGALSDEATAKAEMAAKALGILVALGFTSLPVYVLVRNLVAGV